MAPRPTGKIVQEYAYYNTLGIFQALMKAKEAATAAAKKK
jgi:hypothetical protein